MSRISPSIKLLLMIILVLFVLITTSYYSIFFILLLGLLLAKVVHSRLIGVVDKALHILPLLLILFSWVPFFKGTTVIYAWPIGPFTLKIFQEGLTFATLAVTRGVSAMLLVLSFTSSMTMREFTEGLRALGMPAAIVSIVLLTLRYFPLVLSEASKTRTAQSLRGIETASRKIRFKSTAALIGILFIRAITGAERVYDAMLCRGFKRTLPIRVHRPSALEVGLILVVACFTVVIVVVGWQAMWPELWQEVWQWIQ
jgi:cobalt/nickel transport system permease protein